MSGPYLGNFAVGASVHFLWDTNGQAGASITRATNGTVQVYKNNDTAQSTAGVTDTEDFDGLTGVHACTIDLSADGTFYAAGANFTVVVAGAVIDGQTVNAVLAHFAIENRICSSHTATERNAVADALLKRDMSAVTGEAARSPLNAFRFLRNLWSVSGTTLTVKKEDDSTTAWTATVTVAADPSGVTGVDPA